MYFVKNYCALKIKNIEKKPIVAYDSRLFEKKLRGLKLNFNLFQKIIVINDNK
jgi:hypothetical protein